MACASCGKRKKKTFTVGRTITVDGYKEGTDGYLTVIYSGTTVRKVRGKCTNNIYLFGVGAVRRMDKCDAQAIVELRDFKLKRSRKKKVEDGTIQSSVGEKDSDKE